MRSNSLPVCSDRAGHARLAYPFGDCVSQFRLYLDEPLPVESGRISLPEALEGAVAKRQAHFRAGRYCAMKAMAALDARFASHPVDRTVEGAPVWPRGVVGSITHTDDFAAAAVALTSHVVALGIDTERVMSERQTQEIGRIFAWPAEVAHGRDAGLSRVEAFTLVFSAKESIFKCLYPLVRRYFDFRDVRIVGIDPQNTTFTARLVRTLSERFPGQTLLHGRFDVEHPWVHTHMALHSAR